MVRFDVGPSEAEREIMGFGDVLIPCRYCDYKGMNHEDVKKHELREHPEKVRKERKQTASKPSSISSQIPTKPDLGGDKNDRF